MDEPRRLPIEIGATVADLIDLLGECSLDAELRGSVVVWENDEPVMVIGLAPEYREEIPE